MLCDNVSAADPAQSQAALKEAYPKLRDLNEHCPFTPPSDLKQWEPRAEQLKNQLRVSLGLHPMPNMAKIQPKIYGRITLDGYTIEKVTFETLPGFYVTGNLYRPDPMPKDVEKVPGILCPHGHWENARFYDCPPAERAALLSIGAERFENAARNHIQARCVQLARMGCIVFHWDMIGYCDNQQISFDRAHRFAKQPKEDEVKDNGWLLFSPLAEMHCQSIPGLQTLAGMRGVDFLLTLPEVDPKRIGITGASGGGTQSFVTAAVDPRIAVAFPAVMVSTGMQGGCTCENACGVRTGTGNVELAAVIAPRPLGMTAANDWTKTMPVDGFPELQKLYGLYGAKDKVALFPAVHFQHNFNHVARVSMYGWMNKHFKLGFKEPILERDFEWKGKDDLHVWDAEHPAPESGEDFERKLLKGFAKNIDDQYQQWLSAGDDKKLLETLKIGWQVTLGLTHSKIEPAQSDSKDTNGASSVALSSATDGKWTLQKTANDDRALTIHVRPSQAGAEVQKYRVALIGQSFAADGQLVEIDDQPLVGNPRLAAAYTYCYNEPLFARRTRQLAATLTWLKEKYPESLVTLHGKGHGAALAAAACVAAGEAAQKVQLELDTAGFRFAKVDSIRDVNFLPGAARFMDVPGLVRCCTNQKVELIGEDKFK